MSLKKLFEKKYENTFNIRCISKIRYNANVVHRKLKNKFTFQFTRNHSTSNLVSFTLCCIINGNLSLLIQSLIFHGPYVPTGLI